MGLFTATEAAPEEPPAGAGLTAINIRLPGVPRSVAVKMTSTCVLLTKLVDRAAPFAWITVVGTNPVPVTETDVAGDPVGSDAGTSAEIAGTGLFTVRFTGAPEPLADVPFKAMTDSWPPWASCPAGTIAVTCVLLTYVVTSAALPTWMVVLEVKPVPVTVRVVAAVPAAIEVGEMEVTVGAATGGVGVPEPEPELPEEAHPTNKAEMLRTSAGRKETWFFISTKVMARDEACIRELTDLLRNKCG
jgi:hypothetical protein